MARHDLCVDGYFAEPEPRKDDRERDDKNEPKGGSVHKGVSKCLTG